MNTTDWMALYKGRRCFVTGHTGFKGAWLCCWLRELGATVAGYALEPPTTPNLFSLLEARKHIEDIRGDVRNAEGLADAMQQFQPEIVFHLAAQAIVRTSYHQPKDTFDINVGGTTNLLEAVRDCASVDAIVVVTSDKCYENRERPQPYRESDSLGGHDPYSASKAAAEMVCSAYERSFFTPLSIGLATCRAGNVIGGGDWAMDRIIPDAVRALESGQPVPVRNPASVRPWQHVLEPLHGYLLLGARLFERPGYAGAWNFGPDAESCQPVQTLIERFLEAYGEGAWEAVPQESAPHEARLLALDYGKARERLDWRPQWSFEEAVRRTSLWYRRCKQGEHPEALCAQDIKDYAAGLAG